MPGRFDDHVVRQTGKGPPSVDTPEVLIVGTYDNHAPIKSHAPTDGDSTPGNNSTTENDDDTLLVTPVARVPLIVPGPEKNRGAPQSVKVDNATDPSYGAANVHVSLNQHPPSPEISGYFRGIVPGIPDGVHWRRAGTCRRQRPVCQPFP
jgi:hypothetical protein